LHLTFLRAVVCLAMVICTKRCHVFNDIAPFICQSDDVMRFKEYAPVSHLESGLTTPFAPSARSIEDAPAHIRVPYKRIRNYLATGSTLVLFFC
jgi:hypothetical protein